MEKKISTRHNYTNRLIQQEQLQLQIQQGQVLMNAQVGF
uniref:Uncharacterized protein n=1 Tax=Arundo donax TaxID=35708 RepID=A0A0A9C5G4_ARUDO